MSERARTTLFGIFVLAKSELTTAQVIALAKPVGLTPSNVKTLLSRLVFEGSLTRTGQARSGRYKPSPRKQRVVLGIRARLGVNPDEAWDGTWLMLSFRLPTSRTERDRIRRRLGFDGFRPWTGEVFVRPAWPSLWARARAAEHLASGAALGVEGPLLGHHAADRVARLYELDRLDRLARAAAAKIARGGRAVRSPADAFVARLRVGGLVAQTVSLDPFLPPALWGNRSWMQKLVEHSERFERRVAPLSEQFVREVIGPDIHSPLVPLREMRSHE